VTGPSSTLYTITYNQTPNFGYLTVNKAALTVTGQTAANKVYDGTSTAVLSGGALAGVLTADVANVTLTQAGSFANANAANGKAVTAADVLGGTAAGNYTLTQPTGLTANITPAPLSVTANSVTKAYDKVAYASVAGDVIYSGFVNSEGVGNLGGALTYSGTGQGAINASATPYVITPGGLTSSNYAVTFVNGALTINKRDLTVGNLTVTGKIYDGLTTAAIDTSAATYTGLLSGDSVVVNITGADFVSPNVGTRAVTLSTNNTGTSLNNYNVVAPGGLSGTITAAPLTVTGAHNTVTYNGLAQSNSGASYSGQVGSESFTISGYGIGTNASGTAYADTLSLTPGSSTLLSNYTVSYSNGGLTINPATLSYTANAATSTYGSTPVVTGTVVGLQNGEQLASVTTGAPAFSTLATALSSVGSYPVDATGLTLTSSNYVLAAAPANTTALTINPATLSYTAPTITSTYGSAPVITGGTVSGLQNGEQLTAVTSGSTSFSTAATATSNAGSYLIEGTGLTATSSNYVIAQAPANTSALTIAPKALTVTGTTTTVTYSGLPQSNSGASYSGQVGSESFTISGYGSGTNASGSTYADNLSVTPGNGTLLSNYTVSYSNGGLTINKAPLTVTGATSVVTYNGLAQNNSGANYSGQIGSESFTISGYASGTNASGSPYADNLSVTAGNGTLLSNYTVSTTNGGLTINPATLTVTGANHAVTYSGLAQSNNGGSYSGQIGSESFTISGYASGTNASVTPYTDNLSVAAGSGTLLSNYTVNTTNGTFTINRADAAVTGNNSVVTYDRQVHSVTGFGVSGLVNGEAATVLTSVSAGGASGTNAGSYTNAVTGNATDGNYNLTFADGLLSINKAPLTVNGLAVTNKAYDGATTADVNTSAVTYSGLISGDQVLVNITGADFASANVGTHTVLLTSSNSGGSAGNYDIVAPSSLTGSITAKALTISGQGAASKSYDGTNAATLSGGSLVGVVGSDNVTLSQAGTFNSVNVGAAIGITAADSLSGTGAGNYSLTQPTGIAADITAKVIIVTGLAASNKTYDGTTTATVSNWGGVSTGVGSETLVLNHGAANFADANAGTGKTVTATGYSLANGTGGLASNYVLSITDSTATADIAQKALTISGLAADNKTYDGTTTATVSNWGGVSTGVGSETLALNHGAATFADANAGIGKTVTAAGYTLADGSGLASNYTLSSTSSTGVADIAQKALTISGQGAANKTYDGTNAATLSGGSLIGVIGTEDVILNQAGSFNSVNVGTAIGVTTSNGLSGTGASNYRVTQPTGMAADITAKLLTINGLVVGNKSYDGTTFVAISNWGGVSTGVGSETLALNHGAAGFADANAGTGKSVTATGYSLANGSNGGLASNYVLSSTNTTATADIAQKALTISGQGAASKTYDGTNATTLSGGNLIGVVGTEDVTLSQAGSFNSVNVGTAIGVTTSNNLGGAGASNYSVTQPTSIVADITARVLTVSGLAASNKTYDGTTTAPVSNWGSVTTGVGSETLALSHGAADFTDANAGTGKKVTAAGYRLVDGTGLASNYVLSSNSSTAMADIVPALLTITANDASKFKDNVAYTGGNGVSYKGFVNNETSGALAGVLSYAGTSQGAIDVGSYTITPVGLTAANYAVSFADGQLKINSATLPRLPGFSVFFPVVLLDPASPSGYFVPPPVINLPKDLPPDVTVEDIKKVVANYDSTRVLNVPDPSNSMKIIQAIRIPVDDATPIPDSLVDDLIIASDSSLTDADGKKKGTPLLGYRAMKLPDQAQITTVLANDAPLPTGLAFNPAEKTFSVAKNGEVRFPIQVKIQLRQGGSVVSEKIVMLLDAPSGSP
jgi:hypothetical protein